MRIFHNQFLVSFNGFNMFYLAKNNGLYNAIYIYVYIYIYVCIYIYMYTCIYIYIHIYGRKKKLLVYIDHSHRHMCVFYYLCTGLFWNSKDKWFSSETKLGCASFWDNNFVVVFWLTFPHFIGAYTVFLTNTKKCGNVSPINVEIHCFVDFPALYLLLTLIWRFP